MLAGMRDKLLKVVRMLETDYEPYGKAERDGPDCSSGCRHFVKLAGDSGNDWGVCANPDSPRAGLLTFEHQGCAAFEPILLDRTLTDAQLRSIIGDASEILKDRRRERMDPTASEQAVLPREGGEFLYDVRTSYFPRINGHFPTIFRLEPHDVGFVGIPLVARTSGNERPMVMGRYPAKNGEVFKVVRENGEYSYQVPFNGKLYNLKQYADLPDIGISGLEVLRRFLEHVETDVFEKIVGDAHLRLAHARQSLDENQDRVRRWRNREFRADETPANKTELREMLKEAEEETEHLPTRITETEAFIEWLKGIDRSAPTLRSVPPPPAPQRQSRKR
jgi:hypothetical protein